MSWFHWLIITMCCCPVERPCFHLLSSNSVSRTVLGTKTAAGGLMLVAWKSLPLLFTKPNSFCSLKAIGGMFSPANETLTLMELKIMTCFASVLYHPQNFVFL